MSANLQVVILDLIIIAVFGSIGLWFLGNFDRVLLALVGLCFIGAATSFVVLTAGDVVYLLDLHLGPDWLWLLSRDWRALPWRYGLAGFFLAIALILRFGKWT